MKAVWKEEENVMLVDIEPHVDFKEDVDGIANIYDEDGNEIGETVVYGYADYEYVSDPLYFIPITGISSEQVVEILSLFESWYGDTSQETTSYALEFETLTRMLVSKYTRALIVNPKYLKIEDGMWKELLNVLQKTSSEFNIKRDGKTYSLTDEEVLKFRETDRVNYAMDVISNVINDDVLDSILLSKGKLKKFAEKLENDLGCNTGEIEFNCVHDFFKEEIEEYEALENTCFFFAAEENDSKQRVFAVEKTFAENYVKETFKPDLPDVYDVIHPFDFTKTNSLYKAAEQAEKIRREWLVNAEN